MHPPNLKDENYVNNPINILVFHCQSRDSQVIHSAYIPSMDMMQKAAEQRLHCKCTQYVCAQQHIQKFNTLYI